MGLNRSIARDWAAYALLTAFLLATVAAGVLCGPVPADGPAAVAGAVAGVAAAGLLLARPVGIGIGRLLDG